MMTIMLCSKDKEYHLLGLFCLMVLLHESGATDYPVGGSSGWRVPPDNTNMFNQWAERNRFQIGDSLVFEYQANQDSVLRVTKESYDSCNVNSHLESFSDGHTSYKFNQSGHFYFISGNKDNCLKNEKIWVIVMAKRSNATSHQVISPPSPLAPNGTDIPPPSPLAPNGTEIPPPSPLAPNGTAASPPAPMGEVPPSPSPFPMETPPPALEPSPSAASSLCLTFIGFLSTSVASSLLVA